MEIDRKPAPFIESMKGAALKNSRLFLKAGPLVQKSFPAALE
jgi:hypothetical protein